MVCSNCKVEMHPLAALVIYVPSARVGVGDVAREMERQLVNNNERFQSILTQVEKDPMAK